MSQPLLQLQPQLQLLLPQPPLQQLLPPQLFPKPQPPQLQNRIKRISVESVSQIKRIGTISTEAKTMIVFGARSRAIPIPAPSRAISTAKRG